MRKSARAGTATMSAASSQTSRRHLQSIRRQAILYRNRRGPGRAPSGPGPVWSRLDGGGGGQQVAEERGRFEGDHAGGTALETERALDRHHQLEVDRVAGVARDDVTDERPAEQGEIADEVEHLVANELVAVPEAVQEAVRASRGKVLDEHPLRRRAGERLGADGGMVVVQGVTDPEHVGRHDLN